MAIKSLSHSSLTDNLFYRSMLAGNTAYEPTFAAYDLLQTEVLTGSQASVTFGSLNSTYGSNYHHLQIKMTVRTDRSGADSDPVTMQFNGDGGANYSRHGIRSLGTSLLPYATANQASIFLGENAATSNSASGMFTTFIVDILDAFEPAKYTTARSVSGSISAYNSVEIWSGLWVNAAALTSIQLDPLVGTNFVSGCRFSLYGLRS